MKATSLKDSSSLQIAFTFVVYPSLILAYMGQAAYLSKHHNIATDYNIGFYVSVPGTCVINFPVMTLCFCGVIFYGEDKTHL